MLVLDSEPVSDILFSDGSRGRSGCAVGAFMNYYSERWPKIGAIAAMAMGGVSVLANRENRPTLRSLAVMNSMTMAAHQFEEYVEPGTFPGDVNIGIFRSDSPRAFPFNTHSAAVANASFSGLYLLPVIFPRVTWLGLPPALLGIFQGFAHGVVEPVVMRKTYTAGAATALLLHVPIGIAYLTELRARGPIARSDWVRTAGMLAIFAVAGVATPHLVSADRNSPYTFTDKQLGLAGHAAVDESSAH